MEIINTVKKYLESLARDFIGSSLSKTMTISKKEEEGERSRQKRENGCIINAKTNIRSPSYHNNVSNADVFT